MESKYLLIIGLFLLILAIPVHATTQNQNNASQTSWAETFAGDQNNTFWITLPQHVNVIDAKLNLSGYHSYNNDSQTLALWYLDSNLDSSGGAENYNGSIIGTNYDWVLGNSSNALELSGDTYATFDYKHPLFQPLKNFTVEFWVKTNATNTAGSETTLISTQSTVTDKICYEFYTDDGLAVFQIIKIGKSNLETTSTTNISDNQWHHVAGTRMNLTDTAGYIEIYIDGILENVTYIGENERASINSDVNFSIGHVPRWNINISYGIFDEIRVYNESLSSFNYTYPNNTWLDVTNDEDQEWNFTNDFNHTDNQTANFSAEINTWLSTCSPDANGDCDVPFKLHSDRLGKIHISAINITYNDVYPDWFNNQSSVPSEYNPTNESWFNVTWEDDIDSNGYNVSFIEINYTGTLINYSTTRDNNVSYYKIILGANTTNFSFYANDSENNWNQTDYWTITIPKNSTNPTHINITTAVLYVDQDVTTTSDVTVKTECWLGYSDTGTCSLIYDDNSVTSPHQTTHGVGTHNYISNTSGNNNYTANSTGISVTLISETVESPGSPTGGGGGGVRKVAEIIHECEQGYKWDENLEKCIPIPIGELEVLPPIFGLESFFLSPIVGPFSPFHFGLLLTLGLVWKERKKNKEIVIIAVIFVAILLFLTLQPQIESLIDFTWSQTNNIPNPVDLVWKKIDTIL